MVFWSGILYSQSYVIITGIYFRTFCHPQKKFHPSWQSLLFLLCLLPAQAQETNNVPFVCMELPVMEIAHKWNPPILDFFVSGFFHLESYFQDLSMFARVSEFHFISWTNYTSLYGYTTFCLSICQLIVPTFGSLWISLLCTCMFIFLSGYMLSFLLNINLGIELLSHRATMFAFFFFLKNCQTVFPKQLYQSTFPSASCEASDFSTSSPTLVTYLFCCSHPNGYEIISF